MFSCANSNTRLISRLEGRLVTSAYEAVLRYVSVKLVDLRNDTWQLQSIKMGGYECGVFGRSRLTMVAGFKSGNVHPTPFSALLAGASGAIGLRLNKLTSPNPTSFLATRCLHPSPYRIVWRLCPSRLFVRPWGSTPLRAWYRAPQTLVMSNIWKPATSTSKSGSGDDFAIQNELKTWHI